MTYVCKYGFGIAIVEKCGKYNIINLKQSPIKPISNIWFDYVTVLHDANFIKVIKGYKSNIINLNGNLILNTWFDQICLFDGNNYIVRLRGKYNIINILNNEYMLKTWASHICYHCDIKSHIIILKDEKYLLGLNGNVRHFHGG